MSDPAYPCNPLIGIHTRIQTNSQGRGESRIVGIVSVMSGSDVQRDLSKGFNHRHELTMQLTARLAG